MRAARSTLPRAAVATVVTAMLAFTFSPSQADPAATEQSLTSALAQNRIQLNDLQVQAGIAGEKYVDAMTKMAAAEQAKTAAQAQAAQANASYASSSKQLAAASVEMYYNGGQAQAFSSLLDSSSPQDLLDRAAAYEQTQGALDSVADSFDASHVVTGLALERAAQAESDARAAAARATSAKSQVDAAVAAAQQQTTQLTAQRDQLIVQLAAVQKASVQQVTARQNAIDRTIDANGNTATTVATRSSSSTSSTTSSTSTASSTVSTPPGSAGGAAIAIAYAKAQLGKPYVWGAAGPDAFDCSGLTMRALAAAGVSVPRVAGAQYSALPSVAVSQVRAGDLLFWSSGGSIYHVAMYIGGGQMIQAPRPGESVEIVSVSYWIAPDLAARPF
jgi:peptidoglycan DL-endopeptidase CwlO